MSDFREVCEHGRALWANCVKCDEVTPCCTPTPADPEDSNLIRYKTLKAVHRLEMQRLKQIEKEATKDRQRLVDAKNRITALEAELKGLREREQQTH